jgi:hypothetical protein
LSLTMTASASGAGVNSSWWLPLRVRAGLFMVYTKDQHRYVYVGDTTML